MESRWLFLGKRSARKEFIKGFISENCKFDIFLTEAFYTLEVF
jgi:hypothetical protein